LPASAFTCYGMPSRTATAAFEVKRSSIEPDLRVSAEVVIS
jgi:hypothetical protein